MILDPELDLRIDRVIRAPRARVWKAWTDPLDLARWWLPAPTLCRVDRLDVVPGGAFVTSMSDDGVTFSPHVDACFVVVEPRERVAMTAEITLGEHPQGTEYRVVVRHADADSRKRHEQLGFADGWGTVTAQLAFVAEAQEERR